MLKIDPRMVEGVRASRTRTDLHFYLQKAVELEHSTIPPYLTAYYSLKPGLNDQIAALVRSVVIEEMVHMTIAANVLVSLGGHPSINGAEFVPDYPGPLPMSIGGDLIVHIAPFSLELVKNTFMVIEEPEHPIPVAPMRESDPTFRTIGEFYQAIQQKLSELPPSDFGHVDRQVLQVFGPNLVFPITDADSANRAIDIIIRQGEGTSTDPFESPGEPAHFYRFGEIYEGSQLVCTGSGTFGYSGAPIAFVTDGVFPMQLDPTSEQFAPGTYGRLLSDNFTQGYSALLNSLHEAFNGAPERIGAAVGLMFQLRLLAQKLMSTPLQPGRLETAGPVYKYRAG